ncbi:MAG: C39 family peptidase [Candidatus Riflebacteria bacterium]|nr:C39 family peptidase [Candidatus Riflebacteria bacterium]
MNRNKLVVLLLLLALFSAAPASARVTEEWSNLATVKDIPTGSDVCPFCGAGAENSENDKSGKELSDKEKAGMILFFDAFKKITAKFKSDLALALQKIEEAVDNATGSKESRERKILDKLSAIRDEALAKAREAYLENPFSVDIACLAAKRQEAVGELLRTGSLPYQCTCGLSLTQEQKDSIKTPDEIQPPSDIPLVTQSLVGGMTSGTSEELDGIYQGNEINQTGSSVEAAGNTGGNSSVFGNDGDFSAGSDPVVTETSNSDAPPAEIGEFTDSVGAKCVYISQKSGWKCNSKHRGCGWTSLAMVLRTLGANVDPDLLFAQTQAVVPEKDIAQSGIGYQEVQRLALKYIPSASFSTNGTIADLMEIINLGRPVIVTTKEYGGHFMVVVGYGNKDGKAHIIAHDPESTAYRAYPLNGDSKSFTALWDKIYMNFSETAADSAGPALPTDTNNQIPVASNAGSSTSGSQNEGGSTAGSGNDGNTGNSGADGSGQSNEPEVSNNSVVLDLPKINQINNAPPLATNVAYMSCGPTSTLMILKYFGFNPGIEEVVKKAQCTSGGSWFSNNVSAATSYGLKSENVSIGFGAFEKALRANKPILVRTNDWGGHFVVVTGIKNGKVIVNDPYPRTGDGPPFNEIDGKLYREYDYDDFFNSGFVTSAAAIYN